MRTVLLLAAVISAAAASEPGFRFEANRGQAGASVRYLARTRGAMAFIEDNGIRFGYSTIRFAGENPAARWEAAERLPSASSYFLGADPARWVRKAPHYARLVRRAVYPGIDAVFYGSGERLEFDFTVAPNADPRRIRLACSGARLGMSASGELTVDSGGSRLIVSNPIAYQTRGGAKVAIAAGFKVDAASAEARFEIGAYDRELPLIIDPTVESWSFLGGTGDDRITVVIPGLMAGVTTSAGLGSSGSAPRGKDIFVWDGQNYTVYGGSGDEEPTAAARTGNGGYVIGGWTSSRDFPLIGPGSLQRIYGGGPRDGFFITSQAYPGPYSSYLGGSGDDAVLAVAGDPGARTIDFGGWYLGGETNSADFPVRGAVQPAPGGGKDGFVTRVSPAGALVESTYWGGSGDDAVLALDATPRACWLGGRTNSADLTVMNPLQGQKGGGADGFLARFDESAVPALHFATYFGGSGDDELRALRIGPDGWIWAAGTTASADMPVTSGAPTYGGGDTDVWAARFHPGGGAPSFVTYLGGSGHEEASGIAHDGNGDLYLAGWTTSADLRVADALQFTPGGGEDGFLARLDRDGVPQMLTYVGGAGDDRLAGVAVAGDQRITAGGESRSAAIPAFEGTAGRQAAAGGVDGLYVTLRQDGIYAADMVIGRNLTARLDVVVVMGDAGSPGGPYGPGGQALPVTVRSSDPALVQVQGGSFASTVPATISAGGVDGEAELILSSPGLPPRRVKVRVAPSYVVNPYASELVMPLDVQTTISVQFATQHPDSGELLYQAPAQDTDPAITWRTDQPDVVQVRSAGKTSATVRAIAEGAAQVTLESVRFPLLGGREVRVRVVRKVAPVLALKDTAVGRLMQTRLVMTRQNTEFTAGPADVRVTSEDPSRLLLSASPAASGSASVTVPYNNSDQGTVVWAQGRELGTVRVRIEVEGAPAVFANVAVAQGVIAIATPPQTLNAGFGDVVRDLGTTAATLDLWSTRALFAIYADIATSPAGFSAGTQLPSPEAQNVFGVVSSDPTVAGGASGLKFDLASGRGFALFGVGLQKPGTTTLSVVATGFDTGRPITLTVRGRTLPISRTEVTLGKDLETQILFLAPYDFPRDVSVTVSSSDAAKVLVSANQIDEGPKCVVPVSAGSYGTGFWISALAASGDVPVTLTAAGFESRTVIVHLAPTTYRVSPPSLSVTLGDYVRVSLIPAFPGAAATDYPMLVRAAVQPSFTLTSSDPAVVKVNTPTVTFRGYYANVEAVAVGTGIAELRLAAVSGATVDAGAARASATVVARKLPFGTTMMALGKDLQTLLLNNSYPMGVAGAKIRSLDPSRLLLTDDYTSPGKPEVDARGNVWVQALADCGEAFLAISAPGYEEARLRVLLYPTAIGFGGFGQPVKSTVTPGAKVDLQIFPMAVDPVSGNPVAVRDAMFRDGMDPFEVQIKTSDPSVGRVFSPIAFTGGMRLASTQFRADAKGTTTLSIEPPAGFVDGGAMLRREIEVAPPRLSLANIALGKDMQYYHQMAVSSPPISTTEVTVTSSDPARLLVSADPKQPGQPSAAISMGPGGSAAVVYVQALADSGDVTLTAAAGGYEPASGTVHLEPSYFAFERAPFSTAFPTNLRYHETAQKYVYLTHASDVYPSSKSLRPGVGTVTVPVESSAPSIAAVNAPVLFGEGASSSSFVITAGEAGTVTLQIGTPAGFALAPDQDRTNVVNVSLRRFEFWGTSIGKDRVYPIGDFQPVDWSPAVRLVSSDPARVLLALDPKAAGSAAIAFTGDPKKSIRVYAHALSDSGTAAVNATAVGFEDASVPVRLQGSGYTFAAQNVTLPAGRTATVRINTSDGQPLRPGVAPAAVPIENTNAAAATAGAVTFGPGDSFKDLTITAKSPGVAVLTIRNTGNPTTSSLVVTVTAN